MNLPERESLAEEVLLLALHNERGTSHLKDKPLRCALATATVMDLLLAGKIAAADGQVIVVDRSPTHDPVRDRALDCIGASKTQTPLSHCGGMVEAAMPDIATRVQEQLVARGVLARQSHRKLGVLPDDDRYPERDNRIEQDVRSRLRAVALHGAQPDPRTVVLATLVASHRLDDALFTAEERPVGRAQLRAIALQLRQRPTTGAGATANSIIANAQIAGAANVTGNAFVDFVTDESVGAAFEFVFDVLPALIGGLLEVLSIFDS